MDSGAYTHIHMYTFVDEIDYKKPDAHGQHAWFKIGTQTSTAHIYISEYLDGVWSLLGRCWKKEALKIGGLLHIGSQVHL